MAKKKDKQQVNIQELNLEIDYDKLAEAIVKAQEKSEDEANRKKKFTSGTFAMIIAIAFRGVAILGWLLAFATLLAIVNMSQSFSWNDYDVVISNIFSVILAVALLVILVLYSFMLWKSAKEIETERDRNYIISVFSGIVSFAALIVALVALFENNGVENVIQILNEIKDVLLK